MGLSFPCTCVSLGGCQCEPLFLDVSAHCVSAHSGDFPLHFCHHTGHKHLPPSICPILACRTPGLLRAPPALGAYHFQGLGTEWLAAWLLCLLLVSGRCWFSRFLFAHIWKPHPLGDWLSGCSPARGLRAIPPGRSCPSLRCGPRRMASAAFCFSSVQKLPEVRGWGKRGVQKSPGAGGVGPRLGLIVAIWLLFAVWPWAGHSHIGGLNSQP